jgi:hypothetical protein
MIDDPLIDSEPSNESQNETYRYRYDLVIVPSSQLQIRNSESVSNNTITSMILTLVRVLNLERSSAASSAEYGLSIELYYCNKPIQSSDSVGGQHSYKFIDWSNPSMHWRSALCRLTSSARITMYGPHQPDVLHAAAERLNIFYGINRRRRASSCTVSFPPPWVHPSHMLLTPTTLLSSLTLRRARAFGGNMTI